MQTASGAAAPTGNLVWSGSVNNAAYNPLMTLTSGGNVGIGTTVPIVSLDLSSMTDALALPSGDNSNRPTASAINGEIRYNSSIPGLEAYVNGGWTPLVIGSSGIWGVPNGGTGASSLTAHAVLVGEGTAAISAVGPGTTGYLLTGAGASADPVFSQLNLATSPAITGTLGVANGGTGLSSLTTNAIFKATGTTTLGTSALTDNGTLVSSNENLDVTSKAVLMEVTNNTGAVNSLAKVNTSGTVDIGSTTDTDGMIGVVVGTSGGVAQIAVSGQTSCVFDGATTAGDFVTISTTTAGDCHDSGTGRPPGSQSIGRVLSTNAAAGTYTIVLDLGGSNGGNVPVGTISAFAATSCPTGWTAWTPAYGVFLRGIDPTGGTGYDGVRTPGSYEADLVGPHTHPINDPGHAHPGPSGTYGFFTYQSSGLSGAGIGSGGDWNGNISTNGGTGYATTGITILTNTGTGSGSETRPKNVAVLFCQYQGGGSYSANIGTLTTNDFCTANSSGQVVCNTPSTGSNNVVLSASPTLTGTITAAAANFSGNVGIGTTSPGEPLDVNGVIRSNNEITSTLGSGYGQFRMVSSNYGSFFRNDNTNTYLMLTASGDPYGTWNNLRPFYVNDSSGAVEIDATGAGTTFGGNATVGGNIYWGSGGNWLNAYLNQGVLTTSSPTFSNIYLSYGPGWLSNWLNQCVASGCGPTFSGLTVPAEIYTHGIAAFNGSSYGNNFNFWWTGACIDIIVDSTTFQISCPSDRRVKKDIEALSDSSGLAAIMKLDPVSFYWKDEQSGKEKRFGLIAQEMKDVFPNLVTNTGMKTKNTPDGLLRIEYEGLFAPLIKSVQQLKSLFDGDHDEIARLKAANDALRAANDNEEAQIRALTARLDALEAAHH